AEHRSVSADSVILEKDKEVEHFFMIKSGAVDIIVKKKRGKEVQLAQLGAGQFFGETELTLGGGAIAEVRGASEGAELAVLPKKIFNKLINASSLTRGSFEKIANSRKSENQKRKTDR
ncbi:MAG: cyclic nucleotide-binding domain-containing protein, partial [Anaerolineae bacterium]|nr:cyclic nucleotide-binding domain-containing protein [Anaerolineae bacterium]